MTLIYFWEALRAVSKKARSTAQAEIDTIMIKDTLRTVQCKDSPVCLYHMGGKLTLRYYDLRQLAKRFWLT